MAQKTLTIIGFGRFGQVLAGILKNDFRILVYDLADKVKEAKDLGVTFVNLEQALISPTIFYAVPINKFEKVLKEHSSKINAKLVIDVLSVKCFPKQILKKYLPKNSRAILMHPMFGPDSLKAHGLPGLRLVMDKFTAQEDEYCFWKNYFLEKKLTVIEMSAEKHDQLAARSQGLVFYLGKMLEDFGVDYTPIDTFSSVMLVDIVKKFVANDSWELFVDLQTKNPYAAEMREQIELSLKKINAKLKPKKDNRKNLILGIQGGKGSFNEEAARQFELEIVYLYTTENVLKALTEGAIDRGQFAIHNSAGGIVDESIEAMGKYNFKIVNKFAIKIAHALMIKKAVDFSQTDTIMTHPQVLAQCKQTLAKKYPYLKQTSGEGDLIDHAKVAEHLANNLLPDNIAVMGSKVLAEIYGLKIIEDNLQDLAENFTTFLQVERI